MKREIYGNIKHQLKMCHFTESLSLTLAHKNRRSSVSTRWIGVKFAAIGPIKIKTVKSWGKMGKFFSHIVSFHVAGHI